MKKTMFSAVQPSGAITLGNYIGYIKNAVSFQNDYNCIFALADLHAITVRQDSKVFSKNILEAYAIFLASGINLEKSIFFLQSQVYTHAELAWILSCFTQFGELSRMTQFKDKSSKKAHEEINSGLFCYPTLMAADILLYRTDFVPVGIDQKQHVELTRNIAKRFNQIYGDIFTIPEPIISKTGEKIMSLQEPTKKMSKSDLNKYSYISVLNSPDEIIKKINKSVTDSNNEIKFSKSNQTGINNLINIYLSLTDKNIKQIELEFENKNYGIFKKAVSEAIIEELIPIQNKFKDYIRNLDYLNSCFIDNSKKAYDISSNILETVKKNVGFI
ncbi:MAG: tryptophan--tRNA ligase [Candidatus Paraimprobicoccus trichonymphae]|uniref:Tryptophan--tRNA ligase n=1 Tax=Candidatus Paraimprobicoccus trichonymphae TaxID=3033793 RepID=A0AA48I3T1_9FIRM|nr:MAG: tryptophan--tRNA ligase [Candidatus Paraimprobicoccus trichonymphae]